MLYKHLLVYYCVFRVRRTVRFEGVGGEDIASTNSISGSIMELTNTSNESQVNIHVLFGLKMVIGAIFFVIVLCSSVLSKLTLVSLTDTLRNDSHIIPDNINSDDLDLDPQKAYNSNFKKNAVTVYWQLLIILLFPNCFTFLRCLCFGFLGKTTKSYPWPRGRAVLLVCQNILFIYSLVGSGKRN